MEFTNVQQQVISANKSRHIFLYGYYGCGKTTTGLGRIDYLIRQKIQPQKIIILVPQRALAMPYYHHISTASSAFSRDVSILTIGGLARRMVFLFWPLFAKEAGFDSPEQSPTFLSMETAQYFMSKALEEKIAQGYFESIHIDRNRLFTQILDNMNKSAVIGFPLEELATRLSDAANQDPSQLIAYEQTQECALIFRDYCLSNRLLDYSLLIGLFQKFIWSSLEGKEFLHKRYRHIIYDNVEEDIPLAHDLLKDWLKNIDSALLIYDKDSGYRSFLGADPQSGFGLKDYCEEIFDFNQSFISSPEMAHFQITLQNSILHDSPVNPSKSIMQQFTFSDHHFYPEMIQATAEVVKNLIDLPTSPSDIVILAPYLSDSLLYSLTTALNAFKIEVHSTRPSRSLAEEPVTKCLLTLAKLAHPDWRLAPSRLALRSALQVAISNLDLIRAELCSQSLFSDRRPEDSIGSFDRLRDEMKARITYTHGENLEILRAWLENYKTQEKQPLFVFLSRLFGELLSQQNFALYNDFESSRVTAQLIESIKNFRLSLLSIGINDEQEIGQEYIRTLEQGLIASLYFEQQPVLPENTVLISPAFTFLMTNRVVKYQLWLDLGSMGWWERLNQPLTHPYLLNRHWTQGNPWTDMHEFNANQQALARLVGGLSRRCTQHLFLFTCNMNEKGQDQRSPLLQGFQTIFKKMHTSNRGKDV